MGGMKGRRWEKEGRKKEKQRDRKGGKKDEI